MEKRFRVEADLEGELAELYAGILQAFEKGGSTSLREMNRTLLQTGMLLHLSMMSSFGLLEDEEAERLKAVAENVAGAHLMWEIAQLAAEHWSGDGGSIDLKA